MAERRTYTGQVGRDALKPFAHTPELVRFLERLASDVSTLRATVGDGGTVWDDEDEGDGGTSLVIDEEA